MGRIRNTVNSLFQKLKQITANILNRRWNQRVSSAEKKIRDFTRIFFKETKTYTSLTSGGLLRDFGFPSGTETSFADWLIETIVNSISVKADKLRGGAGEYMGSVHVVVPDSVYKKIYTGIYSHVPSSKGPLPWAEWLLKRGDEIIISEYHVVFKEGAGRSGVAIMGKGGFFKVPAEYSGTESDNWMTRTMLEIKEYTDTVALILTRELLK